MFTAIFTLILVFMITMQLCHKFRIAGFFDNFPQNHPRVIKSKIVIYIIIAKRNEILKIPEQCKQKEEI